MARVRTWAGSTAVGLANRIPFAPASIARPNAVHPGRFLTGYHDDIGAFIDAFPGDQESPRRAGQYGSM
jgi:hypothetical protein